MRPTLLLLSAASLAAVAASGCGSSSSASGSTGPTADGGSGGGGGQSDAGGGGGPADGGGGGGGGGQDECAGLGPDIVGAPTASAALSAGRYDTCSVGSTDGLGTVALIVANRFNGPPEQFTIHLFDPSGAERGSYTGDDTILVEELSGFELRNWDLSQGELVAIDGKGSVLATTGKKKEKPWLVANDPLGGMVVASRLPDDSPPNVLAAYDDRLNLRWRTELASTEAMMAIGVDRQGNTLVLFDSRVRYGSGKLGGIWVDHSGTAGAEFEAADGISSPGAVALMPRVGSGLFLRGGDGSPWVRQFDSLGTGSSPPAWLAASPATTLHMARNGHAYAVISPATPNGNTSCSAKIEVVAPSGKSCGTAVFPADGSGLNCYGALTVGYDGTVVDMVASTKVSDVPEVHHCNFRWWTGFLH